MDELLQGLKNLKQAEETKRVREASVKKVNRQKFHMKYSSSSSSDSASLSPFLDAPSREHWNLPENKAKEAIEKLRESIDDDERRLKNENPVDAKNQLVYLEKFLQEVKETTLENDRAEDEFTGEKIGGKQDTARQGKLEEARPIWFAMILRILFHIMVVGNFLLSWMDSATLLLEDAKLKGWVLQADYNCLELVPNMDSFDHFVNILHALLSCSVLYVQNKNSARLCLTWIGSQGIHTAYKAFTYFFNLKFDNHAFEDIRGIKTLAGTTIFNGIGSLVILHKYYDITNRFGDAKKFLRKDKSADRTLNGAIIFRNETLFLQRKSITRDVTMSATSVIIKKISKHAKLGLRIDPDTLDREINAAKLALADCAKADIKAIPYVLKKSREKWLLILEKQQHDNAAMEKMLRKQAVPENAYRNGFPSDDYDEY